MSLFKLDFSKRRKSTEIFTEIQQKMAFFQERRNGMAASSNWPEQKQNERINGRKIRTVIYLIYFDCFLINSDGLIPSNLEKTLVK